MAKATQRKKHIDRKISPEMARFYQALATLHTNLVLKVQNDPEIVSEVTDAIVDFCASEGPCDPGYVWDEGQKACVRLAEPLQQ